MTFQQIDEGVESLDYDQEEEESSEATSMHDAIESAPSSQQSVDLLNAEILREQKESKGKSRLESVADRSASFHQSLHDSME